MLSQTINNTMAATMIGKEVKAIGNTIELEHGAQPSISFQTGGFADDVDITVRDAAGTIVDTISMQSVAKGDHTITWDAIGNNGNELPPGEYSFSVEAQNAAGETIASDTVMIGLIEAVRYTNAGAIFIVNGKEIPFSSVLELGQFVPEDQG
jgi:flagellar basal-body rod modification protein FlgD